MLLDFLKEKKKNMLVVGNIPEKDARATAARHGVVGAGAHGLRIVQLELAAHALAAEHLAADQAQRR